MQMNIIHTFMAAKELDGVYEAGVKGGGPPHTWGPHASLGWKPREPEPRSHHPPLVVGEMMMMMMIRCSTSDGPIGYTPTPSH